jgi:hypothetical protein
MQRRLIPLQNVALFVLTGCSVATTSDNWVHVAVNQKQAECDEDVAQADAFDACPAVSDCFSPDGSEFVK